MLPHASLELLNKSNAVHVAASVHHATNPHTSLRNLQPYCRNSRLYLPAALLPPLLPTTGALSSGCDTWPVVFTPIVVAALVLTTGPALLKVGCLVGDPWPVEPTELILTGGFSPSPAAGPLVGLPLGPPLGDEPDTARPMVTAVRVAASVALASRPAMVCCRCRRVRAAWAPPAMASSSRTQAAVRIV